MEKQSLSEIDLAGEALFCALNLTQKLDTLDRAGKLQPGDRLLEIGRKAWDRYFRRRAMVNFNP